MSAPEDRANENHYPIFFEHTTELIKKIFGCCTILPIYDTYHFLDYRHFYTAPGVAQRKLERFETTFPLELKRCYALGKDLVEKQNARFA